MRTRRRMNCGETPPQDGADCAASRRSGRARIRSRQRRSVEVAEAPWAQDARLQRGKSASRHGHMLTTKGASPWRPSERTARRSWMHVSLTIEVCPPWMQARAPPKAGTPGCSNLQSTGIRNTTCRATTSRTMTPLDMHCYPWTLTLVGYRRQNLSSPFWRLRRIPTEWRTCPTH